ncbi:MAG: hypothetical protein CMJ78_10510 [Planctomycetaceae bacterium]|nr:hypothetical protein [Planctomycetaceae bacterium]
MFDWLYQSQVGWVSLIYFVFWVWMLVSCLRSDPERNIWALILIFMACPGAVIYFLVRWLPSRDLEGPSFLKRVTRHGELKQLETAAHQIGNAYQYVQWGEKLIELGLYADAGNAFRKALEMESDNLQALWGAAVSELKAKEWDAARPRLEAILEQSPEYKFGDVSFAYCHLLYETGEKDAAREKLESHIRRWRTPQSQFLLATILEEAGETEAARKRLQDMLMDINSSPRAIARKQGHWKGKARTMLRRLKRK